MNKMELMKSVEASQRKQSLPDLRTGDTVRVHYKIKEGSKERIQIFEGLVIAAKKMKSLQASITVRKISLGVGIERTFPLHSPWLTKLERIKRSRVRRAKLYFVRRLARSIKQFRLKDKEGKREVWESVIAPEEADSISEEIAPELGGEATDDAEVPSGTETSVEPDEVEKADAKVGETPIVDDQSKIGAGTDGGNSGQPVSFSEEAKDTGA